MGQIGMATRDELVVALAGRYAASGRKERGRILDEFAAVSGLHRKHAMRLLRAGRRGCRSGPRPARRLYNDAVREALVVTWEASDRVCGKRLRPLVPILIEAMERHGHLQLAPEVRAGLLAMSAATIDRALHEAREPGGGRKRRHAPPAAAIRRSVAVRTFDGWDDPAPGFVEADLVAHSGPTAKGSYVQTLTLTDIATGWTECAPLLVREQRLLTVVLGEMRKQMPFPLLGFDTDNDSVSISTTMAWRIVKEVKRRLRWNRNVRVTSKGVPHRSSAPWKRFVKPNTKKAHHAEEVAEEHLEKAVHDLERVEHDKPHTVDLIINTRAKPWSEGAIDYDQVVALAALPLPQGPNPGFTIIYEDGPDKNPSGTLVASQSVYVKNEMVFHVTPTNRS
jgi:hypothetical protein